MRGGGSAAGAGEAKKRINISEKIMQGKFLLTRYQVAKKLISDNID